MSDSRLRYDVFGLGTLVVDHQMFVDHYPAANSKNTAQSQRVQVGGPVVTALATLSALGNRAYFVGRWNRVSYGPLIEADLNASGIDFRACPVEDESTTGVAHVWVDRSNGDRTIVVTRGTEIHVDSIDLDLLSQSRALHLDGWPQDAALKAAEYMQSIGRPVFLDTGSPKPGYDRLISNVDVLLCPEATAAKFFDASNGVEAARKFLELGPAVVVVTSGSRGAVIYTKFGRCRIPAYKVEAVDTNGAGDVFAGALIHETIRRLGSRQLQHDRQDDWRDRWQKSDWQPIGQFAAAVAATKCERIGNRRLPGVDAVQRFMAERG